MAFDEKHSQKNLADLTQEINKQVNKLAENDNQIALQDLAITLSSDNATESLALAARNATKKQFPQ